MRFCFYAINGIGLGHLARTIAIARALGKEGHDFLFLTSSPATELLDGESLPYVQFPSDHHLATKSLALKDKTYSRLLHGVVGTTINSFDPHVFVVDTLPTGSRGELSQLATSARRSAFILREQRRPPDPATVAAINQYDQILIPHADSPSSTPAGIAAEKVTFTGPILLRSKEDRPAQLPDALEGVPRPLVGVAFGGGGDRDFLALVDWIDRAAPRHPDLHFAVSIPPLLRENVPPFAGENITRFEHCPLADLWQNFDLVISAAGYNSTNELLHFGVPTIFVPLERPLDDQHARAEALAREGAATVATAMDDISLDRALTELKDPGRRQTIAAKARSTLSTNGAEIAAATLIDVAS